MLRRFRSANRKDISRSVSLRPELHNGKVTVKLSFLNKESLSAFAEYEIFLRCTNRYKSQTIKAGALREFEGTKTYSFDEFTVHHDPDIQLRLVNLQDKRIVADTEEHGLPGHHKGPGAKRSLIVINEGEEPESELFKVEWKEDSPRPFLYLNTKSHGGIKAILLREPAYAALMRPAILRSVLTIILLRGLHTDESDNRHECAQKWVHLCKKKGWNTDPAPEMASHAETVNWINATADAFAKSIGLPTKWSPVTAQV